MEFELPRRRWIVLVGLAATVILMPQISRFVTLPAVHLTQNRTLAQPPKLPSDLLSLQPVQIN